MNRNTRNILIILNEATIDELVNSETKKSIHEKMVHTKSNMFQELLKYPLKPSPNILISISIVNITVIDLLIISSTLSYVWLAPYHYSIRTMKLVVTNANDKYSKVLEYTNLWQISLRQFPESL
jgi:hypothetical protein